MLFIELLKVVFIGVVEGITEWLPISSTGHMIIVEEFLQLESSAAFKEMFFVVIQLGAIMAVVLLYSHKLNPFSHDKSSQEKKDTMLIWNKVLVGVMPAAALGFLFDDWLNDHLFNYVTVAVMLIVYGILFIVIENRNQGRQNMIQSFSELTYETAFFIGIFQVLSLIPGTSRSGATILGGILLGASRFIAAEFSFFLSIPIMFGASALKIFKFGMSFTLWEIILLLTGMIVAFAVSVFAIKFLMAYIKNHNFKVFGWYRIILGVLILAYFTSTSVR